MKRIILLWVVFSFLYLPFSAECQQAQKVKHGTDVAAASGTEKAPAYLPMPGPGKKVPIIGTDYYLIYGFDKTPKLGTVILKVEIFNKDGKKDTSMEVKADAGMPSMKGAHDMGDQPLKLSKKGDYLGPINIVMPGDWEVRLTVSKDGKVLLKGSYQFNV